MRITRDIVEFAASRVSRPATAEELDALIEMFKGKAFKGYRYQAESMVVEALNRLRERGAELGLSGTTEAEGGWREVWPAGVYGVRETDWASRSVVLSTPRGTFRFFSHPYFEPLLAAEEKGDHDQMAYLLNLAETRGKSEYEPAH